MVSQGNNSEAIGFSYHLQPFFHLCYTFYTKIYIYIYPLSSYLVVKLKKIYLFQSIQSQVK
jgi:hypothetical protein